MKANHHSSIFCPQFLFPLPCSAGECKREGYSSLDGFCPTCYKRNSFKILSCKESRCSFKGYMRLDGYCPHCFSTRTPMEVHPSRFDLLDNYPLIVVIPDAMVGGVNFLYVKIILQDGTKSDQDITWLRRSRSKEIQKKSISTES